MVSVGFKKYCMRLCGAVVALLCCTAYAPAVFAQETADTIVGAVPVPGGRYVWVPDSVADDVDAVLAGKNPSSKYKDVDVDEKVVHRGDTIPMVLKQRNLGRFDRGMLNFLFLPKGMWMFGLTASYGEFNSKDLELMDIINDVNFKAHSFAIRPYVAYTVKHNLALGVRFGYTSTKGDVNSFKVDIDEDMNFNLHDIGYNNESYSMALFTRQFIGIGRRGRFGVFNEVELAFASGNSDFTRPYNGVAKSTHSTYMDARLNFSPGLCVFVQKYVSFNVSLGVFGFYLRNEKQKVDGEEMGNRFTSGANFRFNIFNINFGLSVHI